MDRDFLGRGLLGDKIESFLHHVPLGDKAYDCDELDETLADLGLEMIAPPRKNRRPENVTQDGRPLRRYRHRWIVERSFAWRGARRRLLVRWEKKLTNFVGFTMLGCLSLLLQRLTHA